MTEPTKLDVKTRDGVAPAWLHRPEGDASSRGVVLIPDAGNVRPATQAMAARLAKLGYTVLLPNIFYRAGAYAPFDTMTVFSDPKERERLTTLVRSLDRDKMVSDMDGYLTALLGQPHVDQQPVGLVGYCIGGRMAFTAAGALGARVGAAASIHGGGLVTDAPDSAHLAADKISASLYFAVADDDASCTPEHQGKLVSALSAAHVRFALEHYPGAKHGFAMTDFPVHDAHAEAQHWDRVERLFASALR